MRIDGCYDLWKRVALQFRVPGAMLMELGHEPVCTVKRLRVNGVDSEIQGRAIIFKPTIYLPILQFRLVWLLDKSTIPNEPAVHYEWVIRSDAGKLDVALHFQYRDAKRNREWLRHVPPPPRFQGHSDTFDCEREEFPEGVFEGYRYRLPLQHTLLAERSAEVMEHLIANTVGYLR